MLISELTPADRLLLDTHVWIWTSGEADGPAQLRATVPSAIEEAARSRRLFVSAASVWEIALKAARGRVLVAGDLHAWVREQSSFPGVRLKAVDARLAVDCTQLPAWVRQRDGREHKDPADRFLVATARRLNGTLLTCDEEILAYARDGHLKAHDARP